MDRLCRWGLVAAVVAVMATGGLFALAGERGQGQGGQGGQGQDVKTVNATLKSVDTQASSITITDDSGDVTFKVGEGVSITVNGKKGSLSDLKAGMRVTIWFKGEKMTSMLARDPGKNPYGR